jgi:uncharacterized membrane protein
MKNLKIKRLVLSAMLLAVGVVLPMLTSQIKEIGDTLLPMHIPVLLCGFICSWKYGGAVGLILPFIRSLIFSMPPLYPNAVWMALELMTYGIVAGLVYSQTRKKYMSLIVAMLSGRIVWGIAKAVLLGVAGKSFTISAFITGGFVDAIPGIVIQLVLIPLIIKAYEKNNKA